MAGFFVVVVNRVGCFSMKMTLDFLIENKIMSEGADSLAYTPVK